MQRDIHPAYNEVTVTCSCGNSFKTRFALDKPNLLIEVCSKCHPFYTGKQKVINTSRVDKFKQKYRFSRLVSGKSNTGSSDIPTEAA